MRQSQRNKPVAHLRKRDMTSPTCLAILSHMHAGAMFALACELAGVPQNVADRWLSLGLARLRQIDSCEREGIDPPPWTEHATFAGEVVAAEARNERDMLAIVRNLATCPDVEDAVRLRAATWMLRQLAPHRYGQRDGPQQGIPAIEPLTPEGAVDVVLERLDAMSGKVMDARALESPEDDGDS